MLKKLYKPFGEEILLNYDVPKPIVYFTTYFLGDISKNLSKDIRMLLQQCYPQIHLRMLYKSYNTIGSRFSFKDKIPVECQSNLVYKYTCESCRAFYIGKTEVQYRCRICQHLGISVRTGEELDVKANSDIRAHCLKCKNHVNPENFEIIDRLHSNKGILLLESLHQKTKTPLVYTSSPHPCYVLTLPLPLPTSPYPFGYISLVCLSTLVFSFLWVSIQFT